MIRRTYGRKQETRSVAAGKFRSGYASASFPCRNAENQRNNKRIKIFFLNNKNQAKTCVSLHQTKREKYTLKGVIFCPTNGGVPQLTSMIHMTMNRWFRSKNRLHELVIYDFLSRYYISEIAKNKNIK